MDLTKSLEKIANDKAALLGFAQTMLSVKSREPSLYESFCKKAFSLLGEDNLIEGFLNSFSSEDLSRISQKGFSKEAALHLIKEVGLIPAIKNCDLTKNSSMSSLTAGSKARLGAPSMSLNPTRFGPAGPPAVNIIGRSYKA